MPKAAKTTALYRRALWVWKPREISHPQDIKDFIAFCVKEKFTEVYYQVITRVQEFPAVSVELEAQDFYRDFLREAHAAGLQVQALFSEPGGYGTTAAKMLLATVKSLIEFNHIPQAAERFDGFHYSFDLLLQKDKGKSLRTSVLEFLQLLRRMRILLNAKRSKLRFSVDMPFWFLTGQHGPIPRFIFNLRWREAGEHLLDTVDEVSVFTYRTAVPGTEGIAALVRPAVEYADKVNKSVVLGLETMQLSVPKGTFAELGKSALFKVEKELIELFQGNKGFAGIAVHDYENYKKLK